jgi:hypothetical protein
MKAPTSDASNPARRWLIDHDPLPVALWPGPPVPGVHRVDSAYVEWFYTPSVGTTAVMLLRRLAVSVEVAGADRLELQELSVQMGFGGEVNAASGIVKTLTRLLHFGHVHLDVQSDLLLIRTTLPSLDARGLRRLSPTLRDLERVARRRVVDPTPIGHA